MKHKKTWPQKDRLNQSLELNEQFAYFHSIFKWITIIVEIFAAYLSAYLAHRIFMGYWQTLSTAMLAYYSYASLSWVSIAAFHNLYQIRNILDFRLFLHYFPRLILLQVGILVGFVLILHSSNLPITLVFYHLCISSLLISSYRFISFMIYKYRRWLLNRNIKVLIVGNSNEALVLFDHFRSIKTSVFILDHELNNAISNTSHRFKRIEDFCTEYQINELFVFHPLTDNGFIEKLQKFADDHFIHLKLMGTAKVKKALDSRYVYFDNSSHSPFIENEHTEVDFIGNIPVITLRNQPLKTITNKLIKRGFDLIFSTMAIILVLLPLYIIIGIFIRLESKGPIIFKQRRAGIKNKTFVCFKFRTMYQRPAEKEFKQATKNDPRITKIGSFLRKTSLDELPQLMNVWLGQMSLVGPRPHPVKLNDQYAPLIDRYHYRHFTIPGITGWAQVNGYRGETKDSYLMHKRIEHDMWYIENWSLWLDLKIIFLTVWRIAKGEENAY